MTAAKKPLILILLFVTASVVASIPGLWRGNFAEASQDVGQVLLALLICLITVYLGGWLRFRWLLLGSALMLAALTLLSGFDLLPYGKGADERVHLFYGNPNLLAASLALAVVVGSSVLPSHWRMVAASFVALALLQTGSRAALIALLPSILLGLMLTKHKTWRLFLSAGVACAVLLSMLFVCQWLVGRVDAMLQSHNLLRDSSNFSSNHWVPYEEAAQVRITPSVVEAPQLGYQADYIEGRSGTRVPLVLYQHNSLSQGGEPYVASIYLRSDTPQQVVLSTQLSRVTCEVGGLWSRCVTPVGYGDGAAGLQLRLEAATREGTFDVYAWGAQLEKGTQSTELAPKSDPPSYYYLLRRFTFARAETARWQVMERAWREGFLASPIVGTRLKPLVLGGASLAHAHNLYLELLSSKGLCGLVAFLIPILGVLALVWRTQWRGLLPTLVCLQLLNLVDYTYFSAGIFYVFWLGMATAIRQEGKER